MSVLFRRIRLVLLFRPEFEGNLHDSQIYVNLFLLLVRRFIENVLQMYSTVEYSADDINSGYNVELEKRRCP